MVTPYYKPEPHVLGWLRNFILPGDRILDVGSGDGRHQDIGGASYHALDSWPKAEPDYLLDLNLANLPTDREFDVILMVDLLEHLPKERGLEILDHAVELAKRAVVVYTPLYWDENRTAYEEPGGFYEGNDHVLHRSLWNLGDFGPEWERVMLPSTEVGFFGYRMKK